jgi:hypothetical protein
VRVVLGSSGGCLGGMSVRGRVVWGGVMSFGVWSESCGGCTFSK